jgi:hypothetical protein
MQSNKNYAVYSDLFSSKPNCKPEGYLYMYNMSLFLVACLLNDGKEQAVQASP